MASSQVAQDGEAEQEEEMRKGGEGVEAKAGQGSSQCGAFLKVHPSTSVPDYLMKPSALSSFQTFLKLWPIMLLEVHLAY